jgi:cobalt/nickel transport protein
VVSNRAGVVPAAVALWLAAWPGVEAHFQQITPSTDIVSEPSGGRINLDLVFTHPMERGPTMAMQRPVRFGVKVDGQIENLDATLQQRTVDGQPAWQADYEIRKPGDYVFFVEPAPYWEPGEGKMIVHYAKVVVDGYGAGDGWDQMIGLPVEIRPLVRPYGIWTGNIFRGIVEANGKPVPFAEIEVEWMNDGSLHAPADAFVTQVIKADAAGAFAYAMPRAGWWGFAALIEGDAKMKSPAGEQVPVERGGLMWVRAVDMK